MTVVAMLMVVVVVISLRYPLLLLELLELLLLLLMMVVSMSLVYEMLLLLLLLLLLLRGQRTRPYRAEQTGCTYGSCLHETDINNDIQGQRKEGKTRRSRRVIRGDRRRTDGKGSGMLARPLSRGLLPS